MNEVTDTEWDGGSLTYPPRRHDGGGLPWNLETHIDMDPDFDFAAPSPHQVPANENLHILGMLSIDGWRPDRKELRCLILRRLSRADSVVFQRVGYVWLWTSETDLLRDAILSSPLTRVEIV